MNNLTTISILTVALGAVLILGGLNYLSKGNVEPAQPNSNSLALGKGEIKGVSIEKNGKSFTLNEKQQTQFLDFLNKMRPVDKKDYTPQGNFDFTRISIQRFDKPDVNLLPVAIESKNLVFNIPILSSGSYMLDLSGGELNTLIQKATQE